MPTLNKSPILSPEQRHFYKKNGYLVIKECIPPTDLARYSKRFHEICEGKELALTMSVVKDITIAKKNVPGEPGITKVQDFYDDQELFSYCEHPHILAVVKELIGGENIAAMHTMLINKPPDNGTVQSSEDQRLQRRKVTGKLTSRHPLHQDQHYFPFEPADGVCCAWTAMEKIDRANGCLVVVPGTHKGSVLPHSYPDWKGGVNRAYHGIQNYEPPENRVHLEMEAGDTVFFHPILIHGSGANRTAGYRKAISCHYANDDVCRYVENERFASDETLQDVVGMAKLIVKKMTKVEDIELEYEDIWRLRARAVMGVKAHL